MTLLDYSKAKYNMAVLENAVKRAKYSINAEDMSIRFLYNCMNEKLETEKELEIEYSQLVESIFSKVQTVKNENRKFLIFKDRECLDSYLSNSDTYTWINVAENVAIFKTENGLFIPENECEAIDKPYLYLGRRPVIIDYNA